MSKKDHPLAALTTPDEDPAQLAELITTLTAELQPRTHLERRQVELIAHAEWDITRHRRHSAQLLASDVRAVTFDVAERSARDRKFPSSYQPAELSSQPRGPVTTGEFTAIAYYRRLDFHAHHEMSIERLEARRSKLLREYDDLRKRHDRINVEEAEVIDE